MKKCKWLLFGGYNPHKDYIKDYLLEVRQEVDKLMHIYENFIIMGDFNSETTEPFMMEFCNMYNLSNLIKTPTCFKNPDKPTCLDLILTNKHRSFKYTTTLETGLSDFHLMTTTVMRLNYQKLKPTIISYRDYKNYDNDKFRESYLHLMQYSNDINDNYINIENNVINILNNLAPLKKKYIRGNQQPFMNKDLSKAIMTRSRLRNIYLKNRTEFNRERFVKQRNYCVNLLRRVKQN